MLVLAPMLAALLGPLSAPLVAAEPPPCTKADIKRALPKDASFALVAGAPSLVALEGALKVATCARGERGAKLVDVVSEPAIDYRYHVTLGDGRLVFGGTGGLVALDPQTLARTQLTVAPPYSGPTCWAAASDDKPVPAWDRRPRVAAIDGKAPTRIAFDRGGPCGFEAEATTTTMVLDLTSGVVRATRNVPALLIAEGGVVLIGDGGAGCDEAQTRGTLWLSLLGAPFIPIPVDVTEPMGFSGLAQTKDGAIWALSGICGDGGATRGGTLWRTPRGGQWAAVDVPFAAHERSVDRGQGIQLIIARGDELHVARPREDRDRLSWQVSRDGGATWSPSRISPRNAKVPRGLAAALGVAEVYGVYSDTTRSWAWTSDGAFVKELSDTSWRQLFP